VIYFEYFSVIQNQKNVELLFAVTDGSVTADCACFVLSENRYWNISMKVENLP
jgi:hypothetical protein